MTSTPGGNLSTGASAPLGSCPRDTPLPPPYLAPGGWALRRSVWNCVFATMAHQHPIWAKLSLKSQALGVRGSVVFVNFHHGVPGPGPEGAEGAGASHRSYRPMLAKSGIQVWLYEQVNMRIEGCIIGFDEYMNLVLDDAEEIHSKTKSRKQLGRIMLKGDNITLLQSVSN